MYLQQEVPQPGFVAANPLIPASVFLHHETGPPLSSIRKSLEALKLRSLYTKQLFLHFCATQFNIALMYATCCIFTDPHNFFVLQCIKVCYGITTHLEKDDSTLFNVCCNDQNTARYILCLISKACQNPAGMSLRAVGQGSPLATISMTPGK